MNKYEFSLISVASLTEKMSDFIADLGEK